MTEKRDTDNYHARQTTRLIKNSAILLTTVVIIKI